MADASYDAIVIGGGHHGLIMGCYLQNAGMKTVILERAHELGGGVCGEEYVVPAFQSSPCAHASRFYTHPAYDDFKLREKGMRYLFPDASQGFVYDDGTAFVNYAAWKVVDERTGRAEYVHANAEKTLKEIARFSEKDAETAAHLLECYKMKWRDAIKLSWFNPPTPLGVKDPIEQLVDDPKYGIDPRYEYMTIRDIAYDMWESPHMRTFFMKMAMSSVAACYPGDVPGLQFLLAFLPVNLGLEPRAILVGGTHIIAHSLQRAFSEMGGEFFVLHEVDRLLIEHGVAKGVRLLDGTEIEAKKLVVSDTDAYQTILRFIGEENVSSDIVRKTKNISSDRANVWWGSIVTHEVPHYKAADFNPDSDASCINAVGPSDPDYFADKFVPEMWLRGYPEKLELLVAFDSIWDETRAPKGKHVALVEHFAPPARLFSTREWLRMSKEIANEIIKQWQWYAPNMTWDNVIGFHMQSPDDIQHRNLNMREGSWSVHAHMAHQCGRFRPIPELSGYKTPVKNFYLCSAATHPGGGTARPCSYNCYKVIAKDFGLPKVWEQKGRAY